MYQLITPKIVEEWYENMIKGEFDLFSDYEDNEDDCGEFESISSILINKNKKVTTVSFGSGDVKVVKCHDKDEFDPYIGFALAYCEHLFGSKTQFHKYVDEHAKVIEPKEKKQPTVKVNKVKTTINK